MKGKFLHLILGGLFLFILITFFGEKTKVKKSAPSASPPVPVSKSVAPVDQDPFSPERLIAVGENVIFGPSRPKFDPNRGVQVGRGQCPACHVLLEEQKPNRFPRLIGVVARAGKRVQEERYQMFMKLHEAGEPATGIKPHAKTAGEYLIESIYCPNCYAVDGEGVLENERMESPMPVINRTGVGLNDYEMVAVVAYLQSVEAQGDLSKVTAKQDWESYFGKKLTASDVGEEVPAEAPSVDIAKIGLAQEDPEETIQKMACHLCHKIPTVTIAQTGMIGPVLTLKTTATQRINSPEYRQAMKEGKVRGAATPKEYVVESIINPDGFIVPGFDDSMPKHFKQRMTFGAVERLAEFLLTIDEEAAKQQGSPAPSDGEREGH